MASQLDMAEQQMLGFHHAKQGFSFEELVISMGLEKREWRNLKSRGMISYLDSALVIEIDEHFENLKLD